MSDVPPQRLKEVPRMIWGLDRRFLLGKSPVKMVISWQNMGTSSGFGWILRGFHGKLLTETWEYNLMGIVMKWL